MKIDRVKPLYRKVNTKARGVHHHSGSSYRYDRNTKDAESVKMKKDVQRGLDYTPLFRFLLSKVGKRWDSVFSEAVARLDKQEPIFWMVSMDIEDADDYILTSESSYFSGLYVDKDGLLQVVAPEIDETSLSPACKCCTHTFNGKPFTKKFKLE
ncbi:hypothetical protein KCM76_08580 [Zooshikella marina]|uniref:Uncharacterized protein n=1 Tax=Zooshikella ganghwensis TaxID=202772 RepID=A0A4P9VVG7_9GAMM|nr:hypothetical protein [Zooshikella ganghwensis]MBU2706037.1 hypothetical protein [Zooshikella ganghwensis]RDH46352.1 hypothetical protein B9G39_24470 [Zooshikella ganghwensis]